MFLKSFIKLSLVSCSIGFNCQLALSNQSLIDAVKERDLTKLHTLLDTGVDPNSASNYGLTALRMAASRCYIEEMEILLNADADPNFVDVNRSTPLIASAMSERLYRGSRIIVGYSGC